MHKLNEYILLFITWQYIHQTTCTYRMFWIYTQRTMSFISLLILIQYWLCSKYNLISCKRLMEWAASLGLWLCRMIILKLLQNLFNSKEWYKQFQIENHMIIIIIFIFIYCHFHAKHDWVVSPPKIFFTKLGRWCGWAYPRLINNNESMHLCHFDLKLKQIFYGQTLFL